MIQVSIPCVEHRLQESGKVQKLFRLEILFNGRKHSVLRRHQEFLLLHKKLKKVLQTPDFPTKRSPHFRQKPVEQRRLELQEYVQHLLYEKELVPQELLDFLQVRHFHHSKVSATQCIRDCHTDFTSCHLLHHSVMGFTSDPYLLHHTSELPDVVVEGVLQGLYPPQIHVSFKPSGIRVQNT